MKNIALFVAALTLFVSTAHADYYNRRYEHHHHHYNRGSGVAPFVGGAIVGGVLGAIIAQPPHYYAPPVNCWYERQMIWDPYLADYVFRRVRVCN